MFEPIWYSIGCNRAADGNAQAREGDFSSACTCDGTTVALRLTAHVPLRLTSCAVGLSHEFAADETVLLNGYQSWTDTVERDARERMRGLQGIPHGIVRTYVLDGGGDYRFVHYPFKAGMQHGFSYGVFRRGTRRVLLGSLDESTGFTLICTDTHRNEVVVEKECPERVLQPGETVVLVNLAIVAGEDDLVYVRWMERLGMRARTVRPLVGYTSWYRHYQNINAEKLLHDLSGAAEFFRTVDCHGAQQVFQIDDGYAKVGDWTSPNAVAFPQGMGQMASAISQKGFTPGIWMAPFVCEHDSQLYAKHPDWLLRDSAGDTVRTGCHWSGAFALDTRNDAVRDYVRTAVKTAVNEWGFGLLKLDFLYAACMIPHDGMTRGQLMADALRLLREAAGEDTLLLGCGVPLASAFGVVDYCRIGCDVGFDWNGKFYERLLHRERISTKNSMANTIARAPLDGLAFGNDPDVFFLRQDVHLSADERVALLECDARHGSVLLTSDDMGAWDKDARAYYERALQTLMRDTRMAKGGR